MQITVSAFFLALILLGRPLAAGELLYDTPGEEVVSSMGLSFGSFEEKGFSIAPVEDILPDVYPEDLAPAMLFEIKRPAIAPISIGRILSSCGCLTITSFKREYMAGERVFLELRNRKPTPKDGATYAFFVQLTAPEQITLRYDVFVKSENAIHP